MFGGGVTPAERNIIDFITISSDGNSVDFGDLSSTLQGAAGAASSTRGLFMGGFTSPGNVDTISYVEIATKGNSADFGNLTVARFKANWSF